MESGGAVREVEMAEHFGRPMDAEAGGAGGAAAATVGATGEDARAILSAVALGKTPPRS